MTIQPKLDFDADSSKISSKEEVPLYNPNPKTDELNPNQKTQNVVKKILSQQEGAEGVGSSADQRRGEHFSVEGRAEHFSVEQGQE